MLHYIHYYIFIFFTCRGSGLQDCSIYTDYSHSDRHPNNDLHCHWEIPGHCIPTENEEAVFIQKSIQDARYWLFTRVACCTCASSVMWEISQQCWFTDRNTWGFTCACCLHCKAQNSACQIDKTLIRDSNKASVTLEQTCVWNLFSSTLLRFSQMLKNWSNSTL